MGKNTKGMRWGREVEMVRKEIGSNQREILPIREGAGYGTKERE